VDHTLADNVVVSLGVESEVTGAVGHFIEEDTLDVRVLGCINVDGSLDVGNSPSSIRGVDVSDHFNTSVIQLSHVGSVSAVRATGFWATVGVDDSNSSDFAGSGGNGIPVRARVHVQGN